MAIHDWSRVDDGVFHGFHTAWITHLSESLNDGILPAGYYAMPEQHVGRAIADVLTLHAGKSQQSSKSDGALAIADAPPRVSRKRSGTAKPGNLQRTLAIREVAGHQIIALIEIVSPGNKDRVADVQTIAGKVASALAIGVHVLVIDVLRPGLHDPHGMHEAIWQTVIDAPESYDLPEGTPLTVVSYRAAEEVEAYLEHLAVGQALPGMPLFLGEETYVEAPLEATYDSAFRGLPAIWRDVLD